MQGDHLYIIGLEQKDGQGLAAKEKGECMIRRLIHSKPWRIWDNPHARDSEAQPPGGDGTLAGSVVYLLPRECGVHREGARRPAALQKADQRVMPRVYLCMMVGDLSTGSLAMRLGKGGQVGNRQQAYQVDALRLNPSAPLLLLSIHHHQRAVHLEAGLPASPHGFQH